MALSTDLISQFVKVTNDNNKTKSNKIVYGTIVEYDNSKYVKIDGSDMLTPISITSKVKDGDRVVVTIKNHTAMVTGNTTDLPASSTEVTDIDDKVEGQITRLDAVIANSITVEYLTATYATIEQLQTYYATIENLEATNASIVNLEAKYATIEALTALEAYIEDLEATYITVEELEAKYATIESLNATNATIQNLDAKYATIEDLEATNADIDNLEANYANIETLYAKKADIDSLESRYANIDFSNIGNAAMEYFYAQSGLIDNVTVGDGTITGKLVGVTISGDLIEGNTIKAEKLVVKGEDGLYYKLNIDGEGVAPEGVTDEDLQNGLLGSNIIAKSITATQISVSDLVAFDATIGGFEITDTAIHSSTKASVDNTTQGVYMDKDGQFAVGNAFNYLKFFVDSDGTYKLDISANSIKLGSTNSNLEDALANIQETADDAMQAAYDIDIGGTQLLRFSKTLPTGNTTSTWRLGSGATVYENAGSEYSRIRLTGSGAVENAWVSSASPLVVLPEGWRGKEVTLSAWIYSSDWSAVDKGITWSLNLSQGTTTRLNYCSKYAIIDYANLSWGSNATYKQPLTNSKWLKVSTKYTLDESLFSGDGTFSANTHMWVSFFLTRNGDYRICKPKLEFGNRATDWSPCPADTDESIEGLSTIVDSNTGRIEEAEASIETINGAIQMLVTDENGKSLMQQSGEGWTFNMGAYSDTLNKATTDIDNLNSDLGQAQTDIENLNSDIEDLGEYKEYIKFGTSNGQPSIELGENDSDFKVVITNTDIQFKQGEVVPASISNEALNIGKAVISDELRQGGFVWMVRDNGNYGLIWKGE